MAAAFVLTPTARADDISSAARGVVRVVITASVDGEEIGRAHGSGFAVAPNRIVTNAHVVELANKFPSLVTIDVVPETGDDHYKGELVAFDADRDLALIQFEGPPLPPLTLYSPALPDGYPLVSLGYPGNVDKATYGSLTQMLQPTSPVRSTGVLSAHRSQRGLETLEHTAQIARGNSGGPLLDNCGRIVGVNRAVTTAEEGDGSFVIALGESELAAFLKENKQPFHAVSWPCKSMEAAVQRDQELAQQRAEQTQQDARDREVAAQRAHDSAVQKAQLANERTRDNFMAGAAFLLVVGGLAIGGGGLLLNRGKRNPAIAAAAAGGLMMVGAIVLFLVRPDFDPDSVTVADDGSDVGAQVSTPRTGHLLCKLDPDRSRIIIADGKNFTLDWGADGCVAGKTQYAETANAWQRVLVPEKGDTVTVATYDPDRQTYVADRYFLDPAAMAHLRKNRPEQKQCTGEMAARAELASRQSSIRSALPALPNERLVYTCSAQ
ncbi:trypsin-like peptidase domain-containing protein [Stakelama marina]|nr:trypsin-like peptidase domain-containing protein [Stakelama marina]